MIRGLLATLAGYALGTWLFWLVIAVAGAYLVWLVWSLLSVYTPAPDLAEEEEL